MNKNDVVILVGLLGVMLGGVGAWAGFNARSQVDKDAVDSLERSDSNLDLIEELLERIAVLERGGGDVRGAAPTETALPPTEAISRIRVDLAAANQRISRATENEQQLRAKVRELIDRIDKLERVSNGMTQALKDVQDEIRRLPRDGAKDGGVEFRKTPTVPK